MIDRLVPIAGVLFEVLCVCVASVAVYSAQGTTATIASSLTLGYVVSAASKSIREWMEL